MQPRNSLTVRDVPFGEFVEGAPAPFAVHHRANADRWLVSLEGEADLSSRETLSAALVHALSQRRGTVFVDVSQLTFCDSTCVTAVLDANHESRMVLVGGGGIVRRVFELLDPQHTIARHRMRIVGEEGAGDSPPH